LLQQENASMEHFILEAKLKWDFGIGVMAIVIYSGSQNCTLTKIAIAN